MGCMNGLEVFIKDNNEVLSILISILSLIVALGGALFGGKTYYVTKEIFNKGIQLDKDKVLRQTGLEFVTVFFIPFSKLKTAIKPIQSKTSAEQKALHVSELLNENKFFVSFSYFDAHKGDVWDSLEHCKGVSQSEAFNMIMEFVEKAVEFNKEIEFMCKNLNGYLECKDLNEDPGCENQNERNKRATSTMEEFFDIYVGGNRDMYDRGMKMIEELSKYESMLPDVLNISEMKRELYRD